MYTRASAGRNARGVGGGGRGAGGRGGGVHLPTEARVDPAKVAGQAKLEASQVQAAVNRGITGHWSRQAAQLICGGVGSAHDAIQQDQILHGPTKAACT